MTSLVIDPFDTRADSGVEQYASSVAVRWTRPVLVDEVPTPVKEAVTCPVCFDPATDAIMHCVHGHTLCSGCSLRCSFRTRRRPPRASWADDPNASDDDEEVGECPLCRGMPLSEAHPDGVRVPNVAIRCLAREWARKECTKCGERGASWDVPPSACSEVCKELEVEFYLLRTNVLKKRIERLKLEHERSMVARNNELTQALDNLKVAMTQRKGARTWCKQAMSQAFHKAGEDKTSFADKLKAKTEAVTSIVLERLIKSYLYSKRL